MFHSELETKASEKKDKTDQGKCFNFSGKRKIR